ncbi:MAG: hypothetical protein H7X94_05995, partial [Vallitaleaceae bacterium]|nr:hypothetical protein [Vallitaleaceae bacterium]
MNFIKLGFIGSYKVDLLHYFSCILRAMNKKVLVIDASMEQFLKVTLPIEDEMTRVTSKGIDFMVEQQEIEALDQLDYSGYDVALIDYGFNKRVA